MEKEMEELDIVMAFSVLPDAFKSTPVKALGMNAPRGFLVFLFVALQFLLTEMSPIPMTIAASLLRRSQ
jgi:hypothetical protein